MPKHNRYSKGDWVRFKTQKGTFVGQVTKLRWENYDYPCKWLYYIRASHSMHRVYEEVIVEQALPPAKQSKASDDLIAARRMRGL